MIVRFAEQLENGVSLDTYTGERMKFRGTIHSILGDHMGQIYLAGVADPGATHGSM